MVTSDRCELLGEHDIIYYHHKLREGDAHVSFIIRVRSLLQASGIRGLDTNEEITPTIIQLLGITPKGRFAGEPINDVLRRDSEETALKDIMFKLDR